jgi:hypothetical protein
LKKFLLTAVRGSPVAGQQLKGAIAGIKDITSKI